MERKMIRVRSGIAIIAICLCSFSLVNAGKIEVKCPEFCDCDVFENLKRAVCQGRRLVSIQLNIPPQAEILDLSDNQISELGDKIFLELGLTDLKLLNLTHNKVHQIHFEAFKGLEKLRTLDLSFNAIEYFTESWFESLRSLEELYLRGNKLRKINDQAPIDIETLRVLDISKCGITRLKLNTLKHLPNLEVLDISENYIQVIQVDLLKALPKLTILNTVDNNFNCKDKSLKAVGNYVKAKQILYTDSCTATVLPSFVINDRVEKFQRMQMADDLGSSSTTARSPRNSWIIDFDEKNGTKVIEVCSNSTENDRKVGDDGILMDIIQLSPWMTVTITFVYGVLCGMVLTCAINLCISRKGAESVEDPDVPDGTSNYDLRNTQSVPNLTVRRNRGNIQRSNSILYTTFKAARRQISRDSPDRDEFDETLVMNEFDLSQSTPVAPRKPFS